MAYERVNWENLPSTNTPVNADNLNKMDEGIANASDVYTKTEIDSKETKLNNTIDTTKTKLQNNIDKKANISDVANMIYPIGSIYMSVNSTSPATLFGGTWERIKDRFLLSAGDIYKAGSTGGSATHTIAVANLPAHAHTYSNATAVQGHTLTINEMPKHNHKQFATANPNSGGLGIRGTFNGTEGKGLSGYDTGIGTGSVGENQAHSHGLTKANANTSSVGSGTALNTMPPYLAVYMWKRIS